MKNTHSANTHKQSSTQTAAKAKLIKLGLDIHADSYRVVRQIDNDTPQPAQKFTPEQFLKWLPKQLQLAEQVHSCYEAGPFGYSLHRQLLELGVKNIVVRPQNWDELGRKVKTDKTDALALVLRLDRYLQGNRHALAVITVPTPEQEQARALSRHREQLLKDRQSHEAQGRSLLLCHGRRIIGRWWQPGRWAVLKPLLAAWQGVILENLRTHILLADEQLARLEKELIGATVSPAKGFGALTCQLLDREILDWGRFHNRRQVASLTGMCPSVRASGNSCLQGSISKHGNPRVRRLLVELAWRVIRFQPDYPPVRRWQKQLENKTGKGGRKKAAVAIGRRLAIDLWRIKTGRATASELGLN
jgi:transposase